MPSPITGQVSVSGSAQALSATNVTCAAFLIKAPSTNTHTVYVGPSGVTTGNGFALTPGEFLSYERQLQNSQFLYQLEPSDFYVIGTSGDVVTWLASPA